jgi:hypothetical protein
MSDPLRFVFGVHLHQPVGNFDYVFADHLRDVYRPFLQQTAAAGFGPITVHISGPLFDWFELHAPDFLDFVGGLAADGRIELLLAGYDEPILASLPRADRVDTVVHMREYIRERFGVAATGLWLTERVWEPELAGDLAKAGVEYAFVDDRHFLVTGFRREQLHQPWRTESDGRSIGLLAIDERLRYLIPFRPPEETAEYLRRLRAEGHRLAVCADDGEKFGGWPGTLEWVYGKGWLNHFLRVLGELTASGDVRMASGAEAMRAQPAGGLAYLPTASYREMEAWALPPAAQQELTSLEEDLGAGRLQGPAGSLLRGAHWRNFLVKYSESNRMHKTMVALSSLARERGNPPVARRAISRAQCNDAYWHGVFGGLYLPILRNALWHQLAIAEAELRRGESLACETLDIDGDGADELWVHSSEFSAIVSPRRGGAVEVLMRFAGQYNLADTLTRRREAYHQAAVVAAAAAGHGEGSGMHDDRVWADRMPPADLDPRALFVDRMLSRETNQHDYARAAYRPQASWAAVRMTVAQSRVTANSVEIELRGGGLEKTLSFRHDGSVRAAWKWEPAAYVDGAVFATEMSLAKVVEVVAGPGGDIWKDRIATVAKSERGLEETEQGIAVTARFPAAQGQAVVEVL